MDFNLQVSDSTQQRKAHVAETAGAVFQDFVGGMYDELQNHPTKLAAEAVAGAALAVGTASLGGGIRTAVAIVGAGLALQEGATGIKNLADQASIINNFDGSKSNQEIAAAHQEIGRMGATAMNFTAAAAGSALSLEAARIGTGLAGLTSPYPFVEGIHLRPAVFDASIVTDASKYLLTDKNR
jgi:hypothetical protein